MLFQEKPVPKVIKSIEYRYFVATHILITCVLSLEPIVCCPEKDFAKSK